MDSPQITVIPEIANVTPGLSIKNKIKQKTPPPNQTININSSVRIFVSLVMILKILANKNGVVTELITKIIVQERIKANVLDE